MEKKQEEKTGLIQRITEWWQYVSEGVWSDTRTCLRVRLLKIANLSVRSFLDRDLQKSSMSLTYSTILAIVPALAMLFAIARGFGFQSIVHDELFKYFPAQKGALETGLRFVESYLAQSSQGVFVGVGIVFLLWTLVSLLSSIEDSFNNIWGVKVSRTIYAKITDYISVCLLVPVLILLSSGTSIFVSTMLGSINGKLITPMTNAIIEVLPFVLSWLAFTFTIYLMPNTKVKFRYAALASFFCMIAFQIVQWLFITGQIYVSRYNAIYGSFSFLPLLLIWVQLSWLIVLSSCVLCYSMQNVLGFNFVGDIDSISRNYLRKVTLVVFIIIMKNYEKERPPLSVGKLATDYHLPLRLVNRIVARFLQCSLLYKVETGNKEDFGLVPAIDKDTFSVGDLFKRLDEEGRKDFIPGFAVAYRSILHVADNIIRESYSKASETLIRDIKLKV